MARSAAAEGPPGGNAGKRADARPAPGDIEVAGLAADLMGRISPTLCMWARRRDDGSLAWLSGGFAELTGRDAEDYLGRSDLTELVHPEDLGMFRGAPGDIAEQVLTWRLVRPDGGMRWVRSQVVATIEVPAGEHFWVGVIEDVTLDVAERQHRQRMEAAFAELSFALNDADAAEVDAALDHGLCLLGELVGADRSYVFRLHGAGLLSNTHEWCAPGVEPAITMLQGLPVAEFGWVMERLAGSPQVLSVVDLPRDADGLRESLEAQGINSLVLVPTLLRGELVGFVGFDSVMEVRQWADVDIEVLDRFSRVVQAALARVEAQRRSRESLTELIAAREAAEVATEAMSRLLSRVSHELRTPASTVVTSAELLATSGAGGRDSAHVERILRSARRQLEMIDDLLEVARSEHRTNAPAARVDVARLARQLLDSATEGTGLEAALRVNGDASILSCPRLLNEVVSNLVSNAVKYNRPGGRLEIEITREDGSIRLDVIDTGIGIDPADIGAIWEPFERLSAEAGEVPGAGLGLAIVANALEELGGSADVTSSPSGTTFSVRLPDAGARSGSADPVSLLLVDDHDAVRSMMDTLLRRAGGFDDIRHARSGAEAVDSVGDDLPSAVLLDRHLPDGLGEALIPRLRALPGAAELPIVILSADVTEAARERSMEAGADAYVVKPARVGDLADLVRSLVVLGRE